MSKIQHRPENAKTTLEYCQKKLRITSKLEYQYDQRAAYCFKIIHYRHYVIDAAWVKIF